MSNHKHAEYVVAEYLEDKNMIRVSCGYDLCNKIFLEFKVNK